MILLEGHMVVDHGVYQTILDYIIYGLSPGSFTTALLRHDFQDALQRAHPTLIDYNGDIPFDSDHGVKLWGLRQRPYTEVQSEPFQNMIALVKFLPDVMTGKNVGTWIANRGIRGHGVDYLDLLIREFDEQQTYFVLAHECKSPLLQDAKDQAKKHMMEILRVGRL